VNAVLTSWSFSPPLIVALLLVGVLYVRGWRRLRPRDRTHFGPWNLAAFLGGLACIYIAIASPLDALGYFLLVVHMLQHLLLMFAAPMLIWLGEPLLPLLMGLPAPVRRYWVAPFLRMRSIQRAFRWLVRPAPAWIIFVVVVWVWHLPALYDTALRSNFAHNLEHASFFYAGLLFWFPVFLPYPSNPRGSRWSMIPYLLLAGVQGTALSALLTFAERVIYHHYAEMPRICGLSVLDDQALAGVAMWIPGSLAYLLPLVWIGLRIMTGGRTIAALHQGRRVGSASPRPKRGRARARRPRARAAVPDLLRIPLVGCFLRWRHARLVLQTVLATLAAAIILDGLYGPRMAPMNLAGVVPWIHWRGFLILTLLGLGNLFCMGCPFMLPRRLVKLTTGPRPRWPRGLRGKWLAVALVGLFFWAYETFSLWDHPTRTAWIALGYFAAALLVDGLFRGAAFCKHVCPIGQFNLVQSYLSPTEVTVLNPAVCQTCRTNDCLRGRGSLPGCELYLLQPRKGGNMDCTFCLDCVHACPYDNVGIIGRMPGRELVTDRARSGLGYMHRRPDLAALILIFVFGAFVNAAGMIAPVLELRQRLTEWPGLGQETIVTTLFIVVTLLALPLLLVGGAAQLACWWSGVKQGTVATATRFAYAFVPLGAGMWLAHYGFHLWTSAGAIVPVSQRLAVDLGLHAFGTPDWSMGVRPAGLNLLRLQIVSVEIGYLIALYVAVRLAREQVPSGGRMLRLFAPWAALLTLLAVTGIWIVFQPMAMRGTMEMTG
jgi:cytochrome c oxidase assembly factor CtaG/polyferredoxin